MAEASAVRSWAFRVVVATLFAMLVLPLGIVVATAFDTSSAVVFPPTDLSVRWFDELLASPTWLRSLFNSLLVAAGTSTLSMVVGTTAALGLRGYDGRLHSGLVGLALLPLLVPGVVIGVTLLTFFSAFGLQQSYLALVLAHSLWATPLTFSVMQSTFARFDWRLHEAALDLGASRVYAFRTVVVPEVRAGLVVAALVAFIVSLQEFVMALFLSGPDTRTVPVQAWNSLRQSLDPLVSVVSTILLAVVVLLVLLAGALAGLDRLATDT
ncbi:ABC transporter permease [Salinirubellus salinus]|uniref:ABC transporter permease n=1 Tax=Salinirubellus salinus TaxID=1364945 RepID=A0A9E7U6L0_9EURY|nr:ABC transporter permease [Salinirubellus salinus]UWM56580.1 ABC transporter permease [Salinirubellus salinus]